MRWYGGVRRTRTDSAAGSLATEGQSFDDDDSIPVQRRCASCARRFFDVWKDLWMSDATDHGQGDIWQLLPSLTDEEYQALKDDIAERGVMVPVEYDEDGAILDGHHRVRACRELGVEDWPTVTRGGMDEADKRRYVRALNLKRRHLNREQTRELIADALRDEPGRSNRQHARDLGVDDHTVRAVRERLEATAEIPQLDRREGADGKVRPAQRPQAAAPAPRLDEPPEQTRPPVSVFTPDTRSQQRAGQAVRSLGDDHPGTMALRDAERTVKAQAKLDTAEDAWTHDERGRRDALLAGHTQVVNMARDKALWAWAEQHGRAVRIDRATRWGNPFLVDEDGDRDRVCDLYADVYWPHKHGLQRSVGDLQGKALGCWCYPLRCHGEHLAEEAETA